HTRAYVTLQNIGAVAVVDMLTLRQAAVIPLPTGAVPFWIEIDRQDQVAYVSDEMRGSIYVIDINPKSPDFDTWVQTISLPAFATPPGLRQPAISDDGRRLYAAAPNRDSSGRVDPEHDTSFIIVVNIDPADRPKPNAPNPRKYRDVIGTVKDTDGALLGQ